MLEHAFRLFLRSFKLLKRPIFNHDFLQMRRPRGRMRWQFTSSAKFTGLILNAGYLSDSEPKYKKNLDLDMNKTRNNGNPSVFCSSGQERFKQGKLIHRVCHKRCGVLRDVD